MPENRDDYSRADERQDSLADEPRSDSAGVAAPSLPLPGLVRAVGWLLAAHVIGVGCSFLGLIAIGVWVSRGTTETWDKSMSDTFGLLWTGLLVAPLALGAGLAVPSIWRLTAPSGDETGAMTARRMSRIGLLALPLIVVGSWLLARPEILSRLWGGAPVSVSIERTTTVMTLVGAVLLLAVVSHVGNLFRRVGRTESLGLVQFEYWLVLIACFVNLTINELAYKIWVLRGLEAVAIVVGGVLLVRLRAALRPTDTLHPFDEGGSADQ